MAAQFAGNKIIAFLNERRDDIAAAWIEGVRKNSRSSVTFAETQRELHPILDAILSGARERDLRFEDASFVELQAMLAEYSSTRARQGFSPAETASAFFILRDLALAATRDLNKDILADFPAFSKFIDALGLATFEVFSQSREAIIISQNEQLLELSTPVVKLWEGVLAVPLVGTLDSARTQVVMESLLQALVATGSDHAIIDITGVPAVDTQVAQHLLKTVFAARLMGAECIISGIRPQIAQTIVGLGIEFGDIATKASLADALRLTLKRSGLEVRRVSRT